MAKNIEFIAAKDLPTTEAEEVDVLCVDPSTGEMRRKPGASLGGSGGGYILRPTMDEITTSDSSDQPLAISTNCDDMVKAIENGSAAYILLPSDFMGVEMLVLLSAVACKDGMLMGMVSLGDMLLQFSFTNITRLPNFG